MKMNLDLSVRTVSWVRSTHPAKRNTERKKETQQKRKKQEPIPRRRQAWIQSLFLRLKTKSVEMHYIQQNYVHLYDLSV